MGQPLGLGQAQSRALGDSVIVDCLCQGQIEGVELRANA
jgi:hypothetical protein